MHNVTFLFFHVQKRHTHTFSILKVKKCQKWHNVSFRDIFVPNFCRKYQLGERNDDVGGKGKVKNNKKS